MSIPVALSDLPGALVAPGLDGAFGYRDQSRALLLRMRAAENTAFCHTITCVYGLYRTHYGEAEDAYLALTPGEYTTRDLIARRNDLRRRESELESYISVGLRLGPTAAENTIRLAVGLVERIPRAFALIGENLISPKHGQEALTQAQALSREQVRDYDEQLARLLRDDGHKLTAIPALREAAKQIVTGIDPAAAERRRQRAEADRTITFRPEDDGMASAFLLLVAEDMQEYSARTNAIAETVCDADPRTVCQRRADGAMMLIRGYVTLGCRCGTEACDLQEPRLAAEGEVDGVIVRYRTLINVVVNERTLADPENTEQGFLVGHGPITAQHARDLAARDDAIIRPFGDRIDQSEPALAADAVTDVVVESDVDASPIAESSSATADTIDDKVADEAEASPTETTPTVAEPSPLVTATGASGYRPSADLARYLSLLYPRCVFPMCTRSASRCQIDHSREYDHHDPEQGGGTTASNLQPLCLKHHQLKTAGIWIDARMPDGRVIWTGPDSEKIIGDPAGTVVRLFPDLLRVDWRIPRHPESPDESPGDSPPPRPEKYRTRLEREHQRRQQIRRRNIEAMQPAANRSKPSGQAGGQVSKVEDHLITLITIAQQRNRAATVENTRPRPRLPKVEELRRPPDPVHPDDEPPPF